ncbi:MAG: DMT family transporter [Candidatus Binatia bacterium]
MSEYFALQASLSFAISHILVRRGLATSNAITGSIISIASSAAVVWILVFLFIPLSSFWTHAVWYFAVGGIFAPGIARILVYIGIGRIGVARSVPVVNTAPMFASVLAVFFLGEVWTIQNVIGTSLVILGVVILSRSETKQRRWRKLDLIYPLMAALSFAIASNLRRFGLLVENIPLMASAANASSALLFAALVLRVQGGRQVIKLCRRNFGWFFAAGLASTTGMLSNFYALSLGRVVIVEPLVSTNPVLSVVLTAIFLKDVETVTPRIVVGAICTVAGTILIVML